MKRDRARPAQAAAADLDAWRAVAGPWIEALLARALDERRAADGTPAIPPDLREAMAYALTGGGKRMRPLLVRLVCEELGAAPEVCERPALAVEMVHAYSLVHDDLPCMDDDLLRRGRPSCHVRFGEALAILAGDGLQAAAFEILGAGAPNLAVEWTRVLAHAAGPGGMVGGQVLDLTLPGPRAGAESVRAMHACKTGALIAAAAELGAVSAGAGPAPREAARRYGAALGALFQVVDDVLDVTGEAERIGKTPGKDARLHKATLVEALGLEGARTEAERLAVLAREAGAELGPSGRPAALADLLLARDR